jgi:hypothetical protein
MKHTVIKKLILCFFAGSTLFPAAQFPFVQNATPLRGETVAMDCKLTFPFDIMFVDPYLLIADPHEGKMVMLSFDTGAGKCIARHLLSGTGTGEIRGGSKFFSSDRNLHVFQPQTSGNLQTPSLSGNLYTFKVPGIKLQKTYSFTNKPAAGRQYLDNIRKLQDGYIGTGRFEKGRFCLYDKRGKEIRQAGEYPFDGESMDSYKRTLFYNGPVGANPAGTAFVVCSKLCDNLEFYEMREKDVRLLKKYGTRDVDVAWLEDKVTANENTLSGYIHVYETNDFCFLTYSGEQGLRFDGKWLFVFDWQGNHLKSFELDMPVDKFCVDETAQILYGIVHNGDKHEIRSYKLP